ncbi:MAG: hypothetical protein ACXADH_15395 [Candidatus Kariarchaeaceae archaeon]|jgi:hypothetical protein
MIKQSRNKWYECDARQPIDGTTVRVRLDSGLETHMVYKDGLFKTKGRLLTKQPAVWRY